MSLASIFDIPGTHALHGRFQVREAVKTAQLRVKTKQENVSGVQLPAFEMNIDGQNGIFAA